MRSNNQPAIERPAPEPSKLLTTLVVIAWAVAAMFIVRYL